MDKLKILKQKISQLKREVVQNNEDSDKMIIALDACVSAKNQIIRELKAENDKLRCTIDRLKSQLNKPKKRKFVDNFFGL